jgi:hypothetical protein
MTDREKLLDDLGKAVAAIMDHGVAGLADEKKIDLARALASGAAEIRMIFIPSTQTFIAGLYSADRSVKPQEIFRIEGGGGPSGEFH